MLLLFSSAHCCIAPSTIRKPLMQAFGADVFLARINAGTIIAMQNINSAMHTTRIDFLEIIAAIYFCRSCCFNSERYLVYCSQTASGSFFNRFKRRLPQCLPRGNCSKNQNVPRSCRGQRARRSPKAAASKPSPILCQPSSVLTLAYHALCSPVVSHWRDGRVAEGGGLLNRYTVKSRIGGSNPPLSAMLIPSLCCSNYLVRTLNWFGYEMGIFYRDVRRDRVVPGRQTGRAEV